jgi:nucleoside-diphosphate-sugar epimerase
MRIFVTGGTGALGAYAVPALVAAGHTVSALARTPDKCATLRRQGAQPVSVSLYDRESLAAAFAGHDVVANLASAPPPTHRMIFTSAWTDNHRVRGEGSANVVAAALKAEVPRLRTRRIGTCKSVGEHVRSPVQRLVVLLAQTAAGV